jgi:signal transduction histidine kinase
MNRHPSRFRNAHTIVASATGLVILVALAVGSLGWRLLAQENALQQQEARDNLERGANVLQTQFFSKMAEMEALLRRLGPSFSDDAAALSRDGAVVVELKSGVRIEPPGQLIYLPVAPAAQPIDESVFDEASKLEFQSGGSGDLNGATAVLTGLMAKHPEMRPEILFRLARVQMKNKKFSDALDTYAKLSAEKRIRPTLEPYGLVSRFQRAELLKESGQPAAAEHEAAALIASLDSGEWTIDKVVYSYYYDKARKLANEPAETPAHAAKQAVAQAVESLWDEWQQFGRSGSRSLTKELYSGEPVPVLSIVNASPDRLVALIYSGDTLRRLIPDPAAAGDPTGFRVGVIRQDGRPVFDGEIPPSSRQVLRNLSSSGLHWQLVVAASGRAAGNLYVSERRNYLIMALAAVVLLVALACYALTRGVLREASAGRLQSDFVSAVSHEFRSPLTTLRQLTELLAEGRIQDEGRRRQYFNVLQKETSRLHQLVEDLLDFGRMDAGRRQYRLESLDFSELVRDSVEEYRSEATSSGHDIEIASAGSPLFLQADREALRRVVRNLLENAVKYSPEAKTVWVETDREGRAAVLRVRDQGIGIPPEEKSRIFDKFVRGDAAKRACIPGTGIGLAMVQEIVRVHHGEVNVSSAVGSGSTFVVRLPLPQQADAREVQEPAAIHGSVR